jgi:hypothetical protein
MRRLSGVVVVTTGRTPLGTRSTTMNRTTKMVALSASLLASIGVAATVAAAELEPLQGYAIPLGDRAAAVYFRQQDGHKELVTTLSSADFQGERTRHVAMLEPGGSAAVPLTPRGILVLEVSDHGGTVTVEVRPDLSAGTRATRVAKAD